METSVSTKAQMLSNVRRARKHNQYKPRTERMAYALAHPNMVEVTDAELRAKLRSYQNGLAMRLLLDTCAVIDLMTDPDSLGQGFKDMYDDPENIPYISAETERELVVHFNNKRLLSKFFDNSDDMLWILQKHYGLRVLPVTDAIMHTYAQLELNLAQDHRDPSDHVIISHAITERLALLSSDEKFPFYRAQGLDLIEYGKSKRIRGQVSVLSFRLIPSPLRAAGQTAPAPLGLIKNQKTLFCLANQKNLRTFADVEL